MKTLFRIVLVGLSLLAVSVVMLSVFGVYRYKRWADGFEQRNSVIYLTQGRGGIDNIAEEGLDEKITALERSTRVVDAIALNKRDIEVVLSRQLAESGRIEAFAIESGLGRWVVWVKLHGVWLGADLRKDDIESYELYVQDVYIGPFDIGGWRLPWMDDTFAEKMTEAYSRAMLSIDVNQLTGRKIDNIELTQEEIIIKTEAFSKDERNN